MLFRYLLFFWVFFLKFLGPCQKTSRYGLFAKDNSSYNTHVRHFAFCQCIVYIVSNKRTEGFLNFYCNIIFNNNFGGVKKSIQY